MTNQPHHCIDTLRTGKEKNCHTLPPTPIASMNIVLQELCLCLLGPNLCPPLKFNFVYFFEFFLCQPHLESVSTLLWILLLILFKPAAPNIYKVAIVSGTTDSCTHTLSWFTSFLSVTFSWSAFLTNLITCFYPATIIRWMGLSSLWSKIKIHSSIMLRTYLVAPSVAWAQLVRTEEA